MKRTVKPADGRRLEALLSRLRTLRRADVKIQPDQVEALKRVVDLLLVDERKANARLHGEGPPAGFGRMHEARQP